eukprot:TRINITY_DN16859_c0_g1_i1.p1 TRINITY_DN16859_c0_g1~~TRINITY_DN16859_c0_g1_i1.p1  ORF type:complete len:626 (+),score=97.97 TRINITY_DN16859_c0_g1_i1:46-1878(+)
MTLEVVTDVSGFDSVQAADTIDAILAQHGGPLEVHTLVGLYPGVKNMLAGRRLVTFLQESNDRFELAHAGSENTIIVKSRHAKPSSELKILKDAMKINGADTYTHDLLASLINGVKFYKSKNQTASHTPIKWLYAHRNIPKYLRGWSQTHPNPAFNFQHQADFGGHKDANAAKLAGQSAYLHSFISSNEVIFDVNDARTAISLSETENATKLIETALSAFCSKKVSAKTAKDATADDEYSLPCASIDTVVAGDVVVVSRISSRSKGLNTSELKLFSEWCGQSSGATPPQLAEVKCGLVKVSGCSKSMSQWESNVTKLASVRKQLKVMAICTTHEDFNNQIPKAISLLPPDLSYRLTYDTYYPEVDSATLPFHDMTSDAVLMSTLISSLKGRYSTESDCDELFIVSSKGFYLLGKVTISSSNTIQSFANSWERRPFIFSGAMEAWIAASVMSVAFLSNAIITKSETIKPASVLDACCGSGTLAAASSILGVENVTGFEIRESFVSRIQENIDFCSIPAGVSVIQQDSSQKLEVEHHPDVVICNAPWGKKFGTEKDCLSIVLNLIASFPKSTLAFVIPKKAIQDIKASGEVSIKIHNVVPLGVVSLIIVTSE